MRYNDPRHHEEETAKRFGGKREIASGAFSGNYDVNSEDFMIDCKLTEKNSYSVDYRKFKLIMDRAGLEQVAALVIHFQNYEDSLVVMREKDLLSILGALDENGE